MSYPEPYNQGKFLGLWLSFRILGQILGGKKSSRDIWPRSITYSHTGAVNLGLNADRNTAGSVSYSVFQVFIAIQAAAPFAGLLLTNPPDVQRTDGVTVSCSIEKSESSIQELKETGKLLIGRKFVLVIPLIANSVFAEAVFFTYQGLWFSVRARALGSLLSGIVAIVGGNVLGAFLDNKKIAARKRARWSFIGIMTMQGAWWTYGTILVTGYHKTHPSFDWIDSGFGRGFTWFLVMVMSFQVSTEQYDQV